MRQRLSFLLLSVVFAALCVSLSACDSTPSVDELNEPLLKDFARDTLQIKTQDDRILDFVVYIAESDEEMRQGLMFIEKLPDKTGMLFRYPRRRIGSMWMKNTLIPLDIFFINSQGEVTDIHVNAKPKSLKSMRSTNRVKGALELAGGSASKYNIRVGDQLLHSHFKSQQ